ncbi:MAG: hypothetical protein AAF438_22770, partial [Pseudomonadota bacterium]
MSKYAQRGGQLMMLASKVCACVSGAVLLFVSFNLFTHQQLDPAEPAGAMTLHHLASLHPPVSEAMSLGVQSPAQLQLKPIKTEKNSQSSSKASARPSQIKSPKLASLGGPHSAYADDAVERQAPRALPWG